MAIDYKIDVSGDFGPEESVTLRKFDSVIADNASRLMLTTSHFRWERDREISTGDYVCLIKAYSGSRILSMPFSWLKTATKDDFLLKLEEYDARESSPHIPGLERITVDSRVMGGKPCIRGLRVTVGMIVRMIAAGHSKNRLLEMYPYLEPQDIDQALEFASWMVDEKEYDLVAI
jgi:uncharacterized protein (DUF433 family)